MWHHISAQKVSDFEVFQLSDFFIMNTQPIAVVKAWEGSEVEQIWTSAQCFQILGAIRKRIQSKELRGTFLQSKRTRSRECAGFSRRVLSLGLWIAFYG